MKIYFVTSNRGKYLEAADKLKKSGIKVVQKNLLYPEIQANSLEEVVQFGLQFIKLDLPFIIEDSGLFIKALNNFPGVFSSFVFKTIGCKGILTLMNGLEARDALFVSVIGFKFKNKLKIFRGECKGTLAKKILGTHGFGYDPIFIPQYCEKTFAEMQVEEKNRYSHRSRAFDKFANYLKNFYNR